MTMQHLNLPREQQRAVSVFIKYQPNFDNLLPYAQHLYAEGPLLPTNFVASSRQSIEKTDLPEDPSWVWTQSNSRIAINLDARTLITFRKLNPRNRGSNAKCPPYKVWLYEIATLGEPTTYFVWCEKGTEYFDNNSLGDGITTPIGLIFPHHLTALDFSFLHPFAERKVAQELGWISKHC